MAHSFSKNDILAKQKLLQALYWDSFIGNKPYFQQKFEIAQLIVWQEHLLCLDKLKMNMPKQV